METIVVGEGTNVEKIEKAKQTKSRKKRNRLIFRSSILVILLAAVVFALVSNFTKDRTVVAVGDQAPDFQLMKMDGSGEKVTLSDLEGKGVMINFWATYCGPCKEEMPYMESLYKKYKNKGIEILAVSVDSTDLVVNRFVDDYGLSFPIMRDRNSQVMELYDVTDLPTSYFVSPEGEVIHKVSGALTLDKLEGYFQAIQPTS